MVLEKLSESLKGTLDKIKSSIFVDDKLVNELVKDIQRALLHADVNVKLVWTPFWNPHMMSEEAKDELGFFG